MTAPLPHLLRSVTRSILAAAAAAGLVVVGAASAWAHVEVDADSAAAGATDVTLTFHVPNEQAPAVTTSITFSFPVDSPLVGVTAEPQNGFTPALTTAQLPVPIAGPDGPVSDVVSQVTFTGGTIEREDDPAFRMHVDKLPDGVSSLTFTALQTYDDGSVVSWTDIASGGAAEPEHPAPVLELGTAEVVALATPAPRGSPSSSLASAGIVVGGLALLAAGIAVYLRRTAGLRR